MRITITQPGESSPSIDATFYGDGAMHVQTLREVLPRWKDEGTPRTDRPRRFHGRRHCNHCHAHISYVGFSRHRKAPTTAQR